MSHNTQTMLLDAFERQVRHSFDALTEAPLPLRANRASVFRGFQLTSNRFDTRTCEYSSAVFVSARTACLADPWDENAWTPSMNAIGKTSNRSTWPHGAPNGPLDESLVSQPPCHLLQRVQHHKIERQIRLGVAWY